MISIEDTALHSLRPTRLDDCRVMIVSGDPRTRERLLRLVMLNAFEQRVSESGAEALAWLETEHCPVVLVDSSLPDLPAEQVCTALRSATDGRYKHTVVLCDPGDPRAVVSGLRAGADDCISRSAHRLRRRSPDSRTGMKPRRLRVPQSARHAR
jgi:DNA-binding response OmpR family regulator